jgi:hypothetical protein
MTPPKACNSSVTKSKDTETAVIADKEFGSLFIKMINYLNKDSSK